MHTIHNFVCWLKQKKRKLSSAVKVERYYTFRAMQESNVTAKYVQPTKVSACTLMRIRVMGCLIWPQSMDGYYD